MIDWKRNLVMVVLSQFLSMMGFAFALPFAPFYIQSLGVSDPGELKLWVALFTAAPSLTLAIFAPIWGTLGDRYGRRIMLMRANFGGMLVLALMGLAPGVRALVLLRLFQGVLTGTVSAAQTFVSVHAPIRRSGMVLGLLSAAVYSGSLAGSFAGGFFAEWFGYRPAFLASAGFLLLAGLLIVLGTREQFARPIEDPEASDGRLRVFWGKISPVLPILALMTGMGFVILFDGAWLPLLVQDLHGGIQGASARTGSLVAVSGVAGFLAGPIIGRLADRVAPPRIGKLSALGAGLMMLVVGTARGFVQLFAGRFGATFCAGGLDPVFQIWLAKTTPPASRGFIFGWAVTAKSAGWVLAPLASGLIAWGLGLRAVFLVASACFFLLIPAITGVVRRMPRACPGEPAPCAPPAR